MDGLQQMTWEGVGVVVALAVAGCNLVGWLLTRRDRASDLRRTQAAERDAQHHAELRANEEQLRRSDVLAWTLPAIDVMQSLSHELGRAVDFQGLEHSETIRTLGLRASILIEQGRLFFRNEAMDYGEGKPEAYRGLRPCILDELVVGCQAAAAWPASEPQVRLRLAAVCLAATRRFVSLAQKEVGRSHSASVDASRGGVGIRLLSLVEDVTAEQLAEVKSRRL